MVYATILKGYLSLGWRSTPVALRYRRMKQEDVDTCVYCLDRAEYHEFLLRTASLILVGVSFGVEIRRFKCPASGIPVRCHSRIVPATLI